MLYSDVVKNVTNVLVLYSVYTVMLILPVFLSLFILNSFEWKPRLYQAYPLCLVCGDLSLGDFSFGDFNGGNDSPGRMPSMQ